MSFFRTHNCVRQKCRILLQVTPKTAAPRARDGHARSQYHLTAMSWTGAVHLAHGRRQIRCAVECEDDPDCFASICTNAASIRAGVNALDDGGLLTQHMVHIQPGDKDTGHSQEQGRKKP